MPTGQGIGVTFNPTGTVIAVAHSVSPYISAYIWAAGFGTRYTNPATLPAGTSYKVDFDTLGNNIVVVYNTSPYMSVYPWSNGFGSKYADPATLPTSGGSGVYFI